MLRNFHQETQVDTNFFFFQVSVFSTLLPDIPAFKACSQSAPSTLALQTVPLSTAAVLGGRSRQLCFHGPNRLWETS